jgi:hypothetical protein
MKFRNGFVSNSSSSSFAISLRDITGEQLDQILNHATVGVEMNLDYADTDYWNVSVDNGVVHGDTSMDNFSMDEFLNLIGVPDEVIEWDYD